MELLTLIGIGIFLGFAIKGVMSWLDKSREVYGDITIKTNEEYEAYVKNYPLSNQDIEMAEETSEILKEVFGEPVIENIQNMTSEERGLRLKLFMEKIISLYDISDGMTIQYVYNPDSSELGAYYRNSHKIELNSAWILSNEPQAIAYFISTICHEFRHAVQWQAVTGNNDTWQFTAETVKRWRNNFIPSTNYVRFEVNPKGYYLQIVEADANAFAYNVMKGIGVDDALI
jgi:hypothetical protein